MATLSNLLGARDTGINGTGKRAYYAMLSANIAQANGGIVLYDENFAPVLASGNYGDMNAINAGMQYMAAGAMMNYTNVFYNVSTTATQASTTATTNYINATNASGELGNAMIDVYSDGTFSNNLSRGAWSNKYYLNKYVIDSTNSNKRVSYLLVGNVIRAIDKLFGVYSIPMVNTSDFIVPTVNALMCGSASYSQLRKEMVILNYNATGGSYISITYSNLDLDKYPDPVVAFARPEVIRVEATLNLGTSWTVSNGESFYNLKPMICHDGTVIVAVMFTSTGLALYKYTRNGVNAIVGTYLQTLALTTTYGHETTFQYGLKTMESRDGNSAVAFCQYYYYGCGIQAFMINRVNATYATFTNTSTAAGYIVLPYKNNGWAFYFCGNCYAGNPQGGYIEGRYLMNTSTPASTFTPLGTTYLTAFTYPNTTNYPGFTQVVDYSLLSSNLWGPK